MHRITPMGGSLASPRHIGCQVATLNLPIERISTEPRGMRTVYLSWVKEDSHVCGPCFLSGARGTPLFPVREFGDSMTGFRALAGVGCAWLEWPWSGCRRGEPI